VRAVDGHNIPLEGSLAASGIGKWGMGKDAKIERGHPSTPSWQRRRKSKCEKPGDPFNAVGVRKTKSLWKASRSSTGSIGANDQPAGANRVAARVCRMGEALPFDSAVTGNITLLAGSKTENGIDGAGTTPFTLEPAASSQTPCSRITCYRSAGKSIIEILADCSGRTREELPGR